jgi:DNA-binding SARP family transcriptional activator
MECKRLLESELGVGPSEETEALYREIAGQAV